MGRGGGKKQHSKDKMYLLQSEWQYEGGGYRNKAGKAAALPYRLLPFNCCAPPPPDTRAVEPRSEPPHRGLTSGAIHPSLPPARTSPAVCSVLIPAPGSIRAMRRSRNTLNIGCHNESMNGSIHCVFIVCFTWCFIVRNMVKNAGPATRVALPESGLDVLVCAEFAKPRPESGLDFPRCAEFA